MSWPVYSERFIGKEYTTGALSVAIPVGKRAIVTHVAMVNEGPNAASIDLRVGFWKVYRFVFPAQDMNQTYVTRCIAYGGETIYLYTSGVGFVVTVHGYLLSEATTAGAGENRLEAVECEPLPVVPSL